MGKSVVAFDIVVGYFKAIAHVSFGELLKIKLGFFGIFGEKSTFCIHLRYFFHSLNIAFFRSLLIPVYCLGAVAWQALCAFHIFFCYSFHGGDIAFLCGFYFHLREFCLPDFKLFLVFQIFVYFYQFENRPPVAFFGCLGNPKKGFYLVLWKKKSVQKCVSQHPFIFGLSVCGGEFAPINGQIHIAFD